MYIYIYVYIYIYIYISIYIIYIYKEKHNSGMSKKWVYLLNCKLFTGKMLIIQWILGQPVFKQNICVNLSTNT
jgi:hypothetical protein